VGVGWLNEAVREGDMAPLVMRSQRCLVWVRRVLTRDVGVGRFEWRCLIGDSDSSMRMACVGHARSGRSEEKNIVLRLSICAVHVVLVS
jgi:hypothetical protein